MALTRRLGARAPDRRPHRRRRHHRAALHPAGHRPHARRRRRHPRPRRRCRASCSSSPGSCSCIGFVVDLVHRRARPATPRAGATNEPVGTPASARGSGSAACAGPAGAFGLVVVALLVLSAVVSLLWTPFDPHAPIRRERGWPVAGRTCSARTTSDATSSACSSPARARPWSSPSAPGMVATVVGVALAALGSLTRALGARVGRGADRHPHRVPDPPHRHDARLGLRRLAVGRHLGRRHRLRREHRPSDPPRDPPGLQHRLRARRQGRRSRPGAEPRRGTCCRTSRRCSSSSCRGRWRSPSSPRRACRTSATAPPRPPVVGSAAQRAAALHRGAPAARSSGRGSPSPSPSSPSTCWATPCATRPTRPCGRRGRRLDAHLARPEVTA